ncbi:MAG: hypothetical protein A2309_03360 [Bacteroidetes bacterium RIFOXYB2_FULL_35_7]|nr:MAG: hypothetical protein A2309_03360 [Bacteroidetes bacterium RIFOXYB2_FULL_35_7]
MVCFNTATAQTSKGNPVSEKSINNQSLWKKNIGQKKDNTPIVTTINQKQIVNTNKEGQKTLDAKPVNASAVINKVNKASSKEELISLRDAHSKTFQNPDGTFTKQQSNKPIHYKNNKGEWSAIDGKLQISNENNKIYEITNTELPVSIDMETGKTNMYLEKDQYISFGHETELIVLDKQLNQTRKISAKNTNNNLQGLYSKNSNEIRFNNLWNTIDKKQKFDYWFTEIDYILNTKPTFTTTEKFLVFKEKVEMPESWQIVKSSQGTETTSGWQGDLEIKNEKGIVVGRFHLPVYYDMTANTNSNNETAIAEKKSASGRETKNSNINPTNRGASLGAYTIEKSGNVYYISVVVPTEWLLAVERVYPVTIDPTASNTYSFGNIASCYYSSFYTQNMNVEIPAGSTVTATNSSCTYVAVSPAWRSDGWIGFQSGSNNDGYYYCNVSSPGTCEVTGDDLTIANGTYSNGIVPFTLKVARDYPSGTCNTTYLYVQNSTWTETVTYTLPCIVPSVAALTFPANYATVQPGKTIHFTWDAPTTGNTPFTYTFYFYNGSSWQNWSAGSNTYFDLQLSEYGSNSWCGKTTQWYVKATNSCGNTNSATRNLYVYPKYSGSTSDYALTPASECQTTGSRSLAQGKADYYSFEAIAGNKYYFSTCGGDLGCGTNTGWDTYLKIYGTNSSCTMATYNDDGGSCSNYESYINGWTCSTSGTYYLQVTGYGSSNYGNYNLNYKHCAAPTALSLTSPANNANAQPGKFVHFTWESPAGSGPFTYTFYVWNGSSWLNYTCDTNKYIDLDFEEYYNATWCGTNAQWYVKAENACGQINSETRNLYLYPKFTGSTADYEITPSSECTATVIHSIIAGGANYYKFDAVAGATYYFSTCATALGCGTSAGWDTYLKIYGADGSCTTAASNDDGGGCANYESFINGWNCTTSGTYYLQVAGYNSSAYGSYKLMYKIDCFTGTCCSTAIQMKQMSQQNEVERFRLNHHTQWLKFTADTSDMMVSILFTDTNPAVIIKDFYVYEGNSCDSLHLLKHIDSDSLILNFKYDKFEPGTNYYLKIIAHENSSGFYRIARYKSLNNNSAHINSQLKLFSLPNGQYIDFNQPDANLVECPFGFDYLGVINIQNEAYSSQNIIHDKNGNILFMIKNNFICNKNGVQFMDVNYPNESIAFEQAAYIHNGTIQHPASITIPFAGYNSIDGILSGRIMPEIIVLPIHGECNSFIIVYSLVFLGLSSPGDPADPFVFYRKLEYIDDNNVRMSPPILISPFIENGDYSYSLCLQNYNLQLAATKYREETNDYLLFVRHYQYLNIFQFNANGVNWDTKKRIFLGESGAGAPSLQAFSEMEIIEKNDGNYLLALFLNSFSQIRLLNIPRDFNQINVGIEEGTSDCTTIEFCNNSGDCSSNYYLSNCSAHPYIDFGFTKQSTGMEFSKSGNRLFFSLKDDKHIYYFNTLPLDNPPVLCSLLTSGFVNSQLELARDGNIYFVEENDNVSYFSIIKNSDEIPIIVPNIISGNLIPEFSFKVFPDQIDGYNYEDYLPATAYSLPQNYFSTVSYDVTWTPQNNPFINDQSSALISNDIIVPKGKRLNIYNMNLLFEEDKGIVLEEAESDPNGLSGGKLYLENTTLTNGGCNLNTGTQSEMWKGITVNSSSNDFNSSTLGRQASVRLVNSRVENAVTGVHLFNSGFIIAENTTFSNNQLSVSFEGSQNTSAQHLSAFSNCMFNFDDNANFTQGTTQLDFLLRMQNVNGVRFYNNNFKSSRSTNHLHRGVGIASINSSFKVTPSCGCVVPEGNPCPVECYEKNKFDGLTYGIAAYMGTGIFIDEAEFTNTLKGTYLLSTNNPTVTRNHFNGFETTEESYGLYLYGCDGYIVEENKFSNGQAGMFVNASTETAAEIYKNYFNYTIGTPESQYNQAATVALGNNTNLQYICNKFDGNVFDIAVCDGGTIHPIQGSENTSARNMFVPSSCPNGSNRIHREIDINDPNPISYIYYYNQNDIITNPSGCVSDYILTEGLPINFDEEEQCPSKITNPVIPNPEKSINVSNNELYMNKGNTNNYKTGAGQPVQNSLSLWDRQILRNRIVNEALQHDTIPGVIDSLIVMLQNDSDYTAKYSLIPLLLRENRYNDVSLALSDLAIQSLSLTEYVQVYISAYIQLQQITKDVQLAQDKISVISNYEVTLNVLAENENVFVSAKAIALLKQANLNNTPEKYILPDLNMNYRFSNVNESKNKSTAIADNLKLDDYYKVYPNPANDYLKVGFTLKNSGRIIIDVLSIEGKILDSKTSDNYIGLVSFDTKKLDAGNYFVIIRKGNEKVFSTTISVIK